MTVDEFCQYILNEVEKARAEIDKIFTALLLHGSIGCVDPLTQDGATNPPGGLIFLWHEHRQRLERLLNEHPDLYITAHVHVYCGYMFAVMGKTTLAAQSKVIGKLQKWAEQFNGRVVIQIEYVGSAQPYMTRTKAASWSIS